MKSLAFILVAMALGGCAANPAGSDPEPSEGEAESREARLEVRNRTSEDMDVYMVRRDQRVRIGLAPSGRSTFFTLTTGTIKRRTGGQADRRTGGPTDRRTGQAGSEGNRAPERGVGIVFPLQPSHVRCRR